MSILRKLEMARTDLDGGRPLQALRRLSAEVPRAFRIERAFLLAEAWRRRGFFLRAMRHYAMVWNDASRREDPAVWVEAGLAMAACKRSLGAVKEARAYIKEVSRFAKSRKLDEVLSRARLEETLADRAEGFYAKSLGALSVLLEGHLRRKELDEAAFVLWAMGGAYRFNGNLAASRTAFERSRSIAQRLKDAVAEAYALFGLGGVTRIMGRLEESARFYRESGAILSKTQDLFGQAYAQCGLANALRQMGDFKSAERHYWKSHRLYSQLEDEVDLAYVEWGLGKVRLGRGEAAKAIPSLRRALGLFHRHLEARGEVLAGVSLAQALHAVGKTREAEVLFKRACSLAKREGLHAHLEIYT